MAWLVKRKDSPHYWIAWYDENGKRRHRTTKESKRRDAERYLNHWLKQHKAAAYGEDAPKGSLNPRCDEFWVKYLPWAKSHYKRSTIESRTWAWERFRTAYTATFLGDVTPGAIELDKARWRQSEGNPVTWNDWHRHIRAIYSHAAKVTFAGDKVPMYNGPNPFIGIKRLTEHKQEIRVPTQDEMILLINTARSHDITAYAGRKTPQSKGIRFVFILGAFLGMRSAEIQAARWEWFDPDTRQVHIHSGHGFVTKNSKARTVPYYQQVQHLLEPYRNPNGGYIFRPEVEWLDGARERVVFRRSFDYVCKKAEMEWVSPHTLRHFFATTQLSKGIPAATVALYMGHSTPYVTDIYRQWIPADQTILDVWNDDRLGGHAKPVEQLTDSPKPQDDRLLP